MLKLVKQFDFVYLIEYKDEENDSDKEEATAKNKRQGADYFLPVYHHSSLINGLSKSSGDYMNSLVNDIKPQFWLI